MIFDFSSIQIFRNDVEKYCFTSFFDILIEDCIVKLKKENNKYEIYLVKGFYNILIGLI